jgi:hypothetical protein
MANLKKLPPEALAVSVALLHLRHAAEDGVVNRVNFYADVAAKINNSHMPMKALGFKKMQYAEAILMLAESEKSAPAKAEQQIMVAHNYLRRELRDAGFAEPTDEEIIAHAKVTQPAAAAGNARILGNYR